MSKIIEFLEKYFEKSRVDFKVVLFLLCLGSSLCPEVVSRVTGLISELLLNDFKPISDTIITWYFSIAMMVLVLFVIAFIVELLDEKLDEKYNISCLHGDDWSFGVFTIRLGSFLSKLWYDFFIYIYLILVLIKGNPVLQKGSISWGILKDCQIFIFCFFTLISIIIVVGDLFDAWFVVHPIEGIPSVIKQSDYYSYTKMNQTDKGDYLLLRSDNKRYFIVEKETKDNVEPMDVIHRKNIWYDVKFNTTDFEEAKYYFNNICNVKEK